MACREFTPVDEAALLAAVERFTVPHRPEVLVVDDEPFVRMLLDAALRHFGFSVRLAAAADGRVEEAVQRGQGWVNAG
jgi:CheY-like chemotaxis protein